MRGIRPAGARRSTDDVLWRRLSEYYTEPGLVRSATPGLEDSRVSRSRPSSVNAYQRAQLPMASERATTPPHMRKRASFFRCTDGRAGSDALAPALAERRSPSPSHRQSLQNLHRVRSGQYSRGEERKPPTSPPRLERALRDEVMSDTGQLLGACASNHCPFTTSHSAVVFEDCEPGATYEAWVEVTNASRAAAMLDVSATSEPRFAQSVTRRHAVVAPGLSALLHIKFEPGDSASSVPGEVVCDSIRLDAPAGEYRIVPIRATMAPRRADEPEADIVGGSVAEAAAEGQWSLGGSSGFAPGQSVEEYFGAPPRSAAQSKHPELMDPTWLIIYSHRECRSKIAEPQIARCVIRQRCRCKPRSRCARLGQAG